VAVNFEGKRSSICVKSDIWEIELVLENEYNLKLFLIFVGVI